MSLLPLVSLASITLAVAASAAPVVAEYSAEDFTLSLAADGTVADFTERTSGRNLLRWKGKFASVVMDDGREVKCREAKASGDSLALSFDGVEGEAKKSVRRER